MLELKSVSKHFFMNQRSSAAFDILQNVTFSVFPGECVALEGPSGMGKSSILKMIYGNYKVSTGHAFVRLNSNEIIDVAAGNSREILRARLESINYVSQFLRVIPRIGTFDLIMQEALFYAKFNNVKVHNDSSAPLSPTFVKELEEKVKTMLQRLNIAQRLWHLPPSTFSGGEQQRVNLAKSLINPKPILLLDEPSASLDDQNAAVVVELIHEVREKGTAILGIFHDSNVKKELMTRSISMQEFQPKS